MSWSLLKSPCHACINVGAALVHGASFDIHSSVNFEPILSCHSDMVCFCARSVELGLLISCTYYIDYFCAITIEVVL